MTSGPVPTNSQNAGWSLYAERIVARSTSVKANPKPLISPAVHFSLIGLFIESRSEYRPSKAGLLSGSCAACRTFAEKRKRSSRSSRSCRSSRRDAQGSRFKSRNGEWAIGRKGLIPEGLNDRRSLAIHRQEYTQNRTRLVRNGMIGLK